MSPTREIIHISKAKLVDKRSPHHLKKVDILIENGQIKSIGKDLKEVFGSEFISGPDLHVSPGWFDMQVNVQDPGFEYKEDIDSALKAAAAGGFTGILANSSTEPVIDGKSGVEYQQKKSRASVCELHVAGALSRSGQGRELAELYDMHKAGALAFADFKSSIHNSQLLKLALLYAKSFDGLIMCTPGDKYLSDHGIVHEGVISTLNGLKGIPDMAEEIDVHRALKILEYSGHKLHFSQVSSASSLELIKKAKRSGQKVTAGVSAANLLFTDEKISSFDSLFKLYPPLRDERSRKALMKSLAAGTLDVVVSDHWPQNVENKECEFELADYGMTSLETTYGMFNTAIGDLMSTEQMVEVMSFRPREILKLQIPEIEKDKEANLTIFQPTANWTYALESSHSRSRNSGLDGYELKGKVVGVVRGAGYHLNS